MGVSLKNPPSPRAPWTPSAYRLQYLQYSRTRRCCARAEGVIPPGGRPQCDARPRARYVAQVSKEDVARRVEVSIDLEAAARTPEDLAAAETMVDAATATAGLARVGLVDEDDAAPGVLARLGHQPLAEAVVCPGDHGAHGLAAQSALAPPDHALLLELGQEHHVVLSTQPLGRAVLQVVDEVADLLAHARHGTTHAPATVMVDDMATRGARRASGVGALFGGARRQVVEAVAQAVDPSDVAAAPLAGASGGVVAREEGAHARVERDDAGRRRQRRRDLVLVPPSRHLGRRRHLRLGQWRQHAEVEGTDAPAVHQARVVHEVVGERLGRPHGAQEGVDAARLLPTAGVDHHALLRQVLARSPLDVERDAVAAISRERRLVGLQDVAYGLVAHAVGRVEHPRLVAHREN